MDALRRDERMKLWFCMKDDVRDNDVVRMRIQLIEWLTGLCIAIIPFPWRIFFLKKFWRIQNYKKVIIMWLGLFVIDCGSRCSYSPLSQFYFKNTSFREVLSIFVIIQMPLESLSRCLWRSNSHTTAHLTQFLTSAYPGISLFQVTWLNTLNIYALCRRNGAIH